MVELINVKPDLQLPRTVRVLASTALSGGLDVSIEVAYDESKRRYVMVSVDYSRPLERGGMTAQQMREIDIWTLVESSLPSLVKVHGSPLMMSLPADGANLRGSRDEDLLLGVARKYALSRAMGHSPLKDVAEWLQVSRATATRIVARARRSGLLDGAGD